MSLAGIELLDRAQQAERALLDEIRERQAAARVLARDRRDEAKVRLQHRVARAAVRLEARVELARELAHALARQAHLAQLGRAAREPTRAVDDEQDLALAELLGRPDHAAAALGERDVDDARVAAQPAHHGLARAADLRRQGTLGLAIEKRRACQIGVEAAEDVEIPDEGLHRLGLGLDITQFLGRGGSRLSLLVLIRIGPLGRLGLCRIDRCGSHLVPLSSNRCPSARAAARLHRVMVRPRRGQRETPVADLSTRERSGCPQETRRGPRRGHHRLPHQPRSLESSSDDSPCQ